MAIESRLKRLEIAVAGNMKPGRNLWGYLSTLLTLAQGERQREADVRAECKLPDEEEAGHDPQRRARELLDKWRAAGLLPHAADDRLHCRWKTTTERFFS